MQKGSDTCIFFSVGTLFKRIFEIVLSKYDQFPIYRLKHQCSYYIRRIDEICRSIPFDAVFYVKHFKLYFQRPSSNITCN